jgi:uncharacterized protein (TIGR03083 family)
MSPDEFFDRFMVDGARFRELLSCGDLDAAIPGCPGWNLADLGRHVGDIYRFAATAIIESQSAEEAADPSRRTDLLGWFDEGFRRIKDALVLGDWRRECWTMAPPGEVRFWARRMCHETSLHLWDALSSQGGEGLLDDQLAADGVDEVVTMFFPRQVSLGRIPPLPDALELQIENVPKTGRLVLHGDGSDPQRADTGAVLSGYAMPLLLLLWNRVTLSDYPFTVTGDHDIVERVLATALTP